MLNLIVAQHDGDAEEDDSADGDARLYVRVSTLGVRAVALILRDYLGCES